MLPRIVEYLLSVRMPGDRQGTSSVIGRPLVYQGASQTIIQVFPPNMVMEYALLPIAGDYMSIVYSLAFDPQMVPGAFYGSASYMGSQTYASIVNDWWLHNDVYAWIAITNEHPASVRVRNTTGLNQYYAGNVFYLSILSEDDANKVLHYLEALIPDKNSILGWQAAALLDVMERR
jgi:hypothetical protein